MFNIPKELAKEVSFAVSVVIQTSLEDTPKNREAFNAKLEQDHLTVTVVNGIAEFAVDGKSLDLDGLNSPDVKSIEDPTPCTTPKVYDCNPPYQEKELVSEVKTLKTSIENVRVTDQTSPHNVSHCQEAGVNVIKNIEESTKPIKSKEPSVEKERESRNAGKIFSDAIANLKSQDHPPLPSKSPSPTVPSRSSTECPWKKGDAVVVKSVTGVWQHATVLEVRPDRVPGVLVSSPGSPPMWKRTKDVRSSSVPLDALNLIEKDLNSNNVRPQGDGEVAEITKPCLPPPNVVGKVRDWMDKNIDINVKSSAPSEKSPKKLDFTKAIPQGPKLVTYIQNSAGSNHVQAVLSTSNLNLARYVYVMHYVVS